MTDNKEPKHDIVIAPIRKGMSFKDNNKAPAKHLIDNIFALRILRFVFIMSWLGGFPYLLRVTGVGEWTSLFVGLITYLLVGSLIQQKIRNRIDVLLIPSNNAPGN